MPANPRADDASIDARVDSRLRFLEAHGQKHQGLHRRLAQRVEALCSDLEAERSKREQLEKQVSNLERQIRESESRIRAIESSRIWRGLVWLGGVALHLAFTRKSADRRAVETGEPNDTPEIAARPPSNLPPETARRIEEANGERVPAPPAEGGRPEISPDEWANVLRAAGQRLPPSNPSPLFTILTPLFDTNSEWLGRAALSVFEQTMTDWEWCLIDDGSELKLPGTILSALCANPRVRVKQLTEHVGISAALNIGLQMAAGRFVCFLDHDDLLSAHSLDRCAAALQTGCDAVYTDEQKISETGAPIQLFRKPDWSPEYFRSFMYVGHLLCVRRDIAIAAGGFDPRYDRIQDFEFLLRYSELTQEIAHVDQVLYHWRAAPGSVASDQQAKGDLARLQEEAVQSHLDRLNIPADARPGSATHSLEIVPRGTPSYRQVSIVIPVSDDLPVLGSCFAGLSSAASGLDLEVICVGGASISHDINQLIHAFGAKFLFSDLHCRSQSYNCGGRVATGSYLVFLDPLIEPITPGWIRQMLYYSNQKDVGAVGGVILGQDGVVQEAGIAVNNRSIAEPMWRGQPGDSKDWFGSLACAHEVSAIGGACLMVRRDLFLEVDGFNTSFTTALYDVDFCLQLSAINKRNIFTPRARFLRREPAIADPPVSSADRALFEDRWHDALVSGDRYYRPSSG